MKSGRQSLLYKINDRKVSEPDPDLFKEVIKQRFLKRQDNSEERNLNIEGYFKERNERRQKANKEGEEDKSSPRSKERPSKQNQLEMVKNNLKILRRQPSKDKPPMSGMVRPKHTKNVSITNLPKPPSG